MSLNALPSQELEYDCLEVVRQGLVVREELNMVILLLLQRLSHNTVAHCFNLMSSAIQDSQTPSQVSQIVERLVSI